MVSATLSLHHARLSVRLYSLRRRNGGYRPRIGAANGACLQSLSRGNSALNQHLIRLNLGHNAIRLLSWMEGFEGSMFIKFAPGECGSPSLIFSHYSHSTCMHGLPQLNKAQYSHIHLTAATSLSPPLGHEGMAFSVFCGHLSWYDMRSGRSDKIRLARLVRPWHTYIFALQAHRFLHRISPHQIYESLIIDSVTIVVSQSNDNL